MKVDRALATRAPDPAELVFAALYTAERRPHARWMSLIRTRLATHQLHARGHGLVEEVFEQLAMRYLLDSLEDRTPSELAVGAWLHRRFAWDSYRTAERIVRSGGALPLGEDPSGDHMPTPASSDTFELVAFSLLEQRVGEIVSSLPYAERTAVGARMLCGMSPEQAYAMLDLPRGSRERANHNQAFAAGIAKLRSALSGEGWWRTSARPMTAATASAPLA